VTTTFWTLYIIDRELIFPASLDKIYPVWLNHMWVSVCVHLYIVYTLRDAKSPISDRRLPYLDIHYGLPYGRTYLPFSPFTCGASGGDHHTHAGEAAVLLLDCQAHHCLLICAVLVQTRDARDIARL